MILIAHVATIARCLVYTILTPDSFITNVSALSLQTLHGNVIFYLLLSSSIKNYYY
jgi:hypothetical protein